MAKDEQPSPDDRFTPGDEHTLAPGDGQQLAPGARQHRNGLSKSELDRRFEQAYAENLRDVYSFAYYRLGNHHDAEDLTEQVFVQAYRHFAKAVEQADGRPLRPWLIRIAQNLAINLYRDRSRKPQAPLESAGEVTTGHDTEELVEVRAELAEVLQEVARLSDDRREALIMRFALGMDNREIARALGKTEGATKVLLHRAIKQLEAQIKANAAEPVEPLT